MSACCHWDEPITALSGVGAKRAAAYAKLGIRTVGDLLRHYPRAYEDWSQPCRIADAAYDQPCCIRVRVISEVREHFVRKGMILYRFTATDGVDRLNATVFNNKYAVAPIKLGSEWLLFGSVTRRVGGWDMASPQILPVEQGARIHPIYPRTEGLTDRMLQTNMTAALRRLSPILDEDVLPDEVRLKHQLCTRRYALENIHFPADAKALELARRRLVFEELLILQLGLLRIKSRQRSRTAVTVTTDHTDAYRQALPFSLTGAQSRAIADCLRDMQGNVPMSRLIQGDVGSGKTAVAAGAVYSLVKNGWQAALMAPTEILAEQHQRTLQGLLSPLGIRVALLTAAVKGKARREILDQLAAGDIDLLVGTHALLSEGVVFARLGLVITDEQHRFGVAQRSALAAKGAHPHLLVMSATPIPRTLALLLYGDLDVSVLDELPPGRQPVKTYAVGSDKRERAYNFLKKYIAAGRQAYIVCPLVEQQADEDAAEDRYAHHPEAELAAATDYAEKLRQGAFTGIPVGLLHGRMKPAEKEAVMRAFAAGEIKLLVSTTVIEVGVDVPNAVIMLIENAERFGLAQLHQLRGRVGRGQQESFCILVSDAHGEEARRRLQVLCDTNDGFRVADEDLRQRGPGDFFGNRQSGLPDLKIANLMGDMPTLREAQTAARTLLKDDPDLQVQEHRLLADEITRLFASIGEQGLN